MTERDLTNDFPGCGAMEGLPCAQAWYLRTWRDFRMDNPPQRHGRMEIMYVLSGTCEMGAGNRPVPLGGQAFFPFDPAGIVERRTMHRGDLLFLDVDVPHTLVTEPGSDCRMLNVEYVFQSMSGPYPDVGAQRAAAPAMDALFRNLPPYLFLKDTRDVGGILRSLVLALDEGALPSGLLVQSLFTALHLRMAEVLEEQERHLADIRERHVASAIRYMRSHGDRELHVADIAASIPVHPAYLQRCFRKSTGLSLVEWLTRHRVEQARMLLLSTDLPVADICGYVGLNSRQHFSSIFKAQTGMSPGEYRRSQCRRKFAESRP